MRTRFIITVDVHCQYCINVVQITHNQYLLFSILPQFSTLSVYCSCNSFTAKTADNVSLLFLTLNKLRPDNVTISYSANS